MKFVNIGKEKVGEGYPTFIVAEIGINHNGDLRLAKELIDAAKIAGCNAVKFQKRTPQICVPKSQRDKMRDTPWGYITYLEYREHIEFDLSEYKEIDRYCKERDIRWFASCWDIPSVDFIELFDPVCYKIPSACITDEQLLIHIREKGRPVIMSTGMSTIEQVRHAVSIIGDQNLVLLHTTSTYPCPESDLNLRMILTLKSELGIPVGYSGHETGLATTVSAVALGASVIERHITLDRAMWGTDQSASVEPGGFSRLVRDIRSLEVAMGDGIKRISPGEIEIMTKLRKI